MGTSSLRKSKAFPKWGRAPSRKTRLSPNGDVLTQEKQGFPQVGGITAHNPQKKLLTKQRVSLIIIKHSSGMQNKYGGIAQLARAPGSYPVGREFESLRRYQIVFY